MIISVAPQNEPERAVMKKKTKTKQLVEVKDQTLSQNKYRI